MRKQEKEENVAHTSKDGGREDEREKGMEGGGGKEREALSERGEWGEEERGGGRGRNTEIDTHTQMEGEKDG